MLTHITRAACCLPAGLEVILEEAEEEYVTTSEEEDEEAEPAASLASLEGSEGIGSAEGDLRSNGSLERCSTLSSSGQSRVGSAGLGSAAESGLCRLLRHSTAIQHASYRYQSNLPWKRAAITLGTSGDKHYA